MPRAAGSRNHYTFILKNLDTDRYRTDVRIELPSVTHIIGSTFAKPQLVPWAYRQTLDSIAGLVSVHLGATEDHPDTELTILESLSDAEELDLYLKENRLRPTDVSLDAADRGTQAHEFLERLCKADEETAQRLAQRALESPDATVEGRRWDKAIAGWWLDTNPIVEAAEVVLISTHHGYAGSVDMVWWDADGNLTVTDLKSRKEKATSYTSDHLQVSAYEVAWNETHDKHIDRRTVLVARPDGTWQEDEVTMGTEPWLNLLAVYKGLRA